MAAAFAMGVKAQMTDVTSQYITNPGFEDCEALEIKPLSYSYVAGGTEYSLGEGVDVMANYKDTLGTDYAEKGWTLVKQLPSANGAVVPYGSLIRYAKTGIEKNTLNAPSADFGSKALCFSGSKGVTYLSSNEVTLPAGSYRFTVHLYVPYAGTSSIPDSIKAWTATGFVANDGTKYFSTGRDEGSDLYFKTNKWNTEVIKIQLTEAITGRFQLNYGNNYYVAIDNLTLEYENKIITDELDAAIEKADKLYTAIGGNTQLASAIETASNYAANPTSQDGVTTEAGKLYAAMGEALKTVTAPVEITAVYVENASFEMDKMDKWESTLEQLSLPDGSVSTEYIKGDYYAGLSYGSTAKPKLSQLIKNLPEGFYIMDAKVQGSGDLVLGGAKTTCTGGSTANGLFLRTCTAVLNSAGGDLTIGMESNKTINIDDIRLFYGPSETSLLERVHKDVKTDAEAIIAKSTYANVTGSERTEAEAYVNAESVENLGVLIGYINSTVNTFASAKDNYDNLAKAKTKVATFTNEAYPFAKAELHEKLQQLITADVANATEANAAADGINAYADSIYTSNAYAEGVPNRTDYSAKVLGGTLQGTSINTAWQISNMGVRTDLTKNNAYVDPKTHETVKVVMGTKSDYYNSGAGQTAYMQQTIADLPAGKYVFAAKMMAYQGLNVNVKIGGLTRGTYTGVGKIGGGKLGAGWNELVFGFEKATDGNVIMRIEDEANTQYKEWFINDIRIYGYSEDHNPEVDGISVVTTARQNNQYYDLQGRRVAQPTKGLYIIGGKKVLVK